VANKKQVTLLIGVDLNDLSVAFDAVDDRLFLDRLQLEFGVTETVLQSYLESRSHFVKISQHQSPVGRVDEVRGLCLGFCYSRFTAVRCSMSSSTMVYSTTSTLTTHSSISLCALTTHPLGCLF